MQPYIWIGESEQQFQPICRREKERTSSMGERNKTN